MKKIVKKSVINQQFLIFFVLILFFFTISCQNSVKNCKIKPNVKEIAESAIENHQNLAETEWRSADLVCEY